MTARIYRLRGVLVAPLVLAAALIRWGDVDDLPIAWAVGLTLFAAGWGLRMWAQSHLAYRLRRRTELTTCGPYAWVRNPLYLANATMALGAVVASQTLWLVPLALLWYAAVYGFTVRYEEGHLAERFGAVYAHYQRSVPRWLPARPADRASCAHGALRPALVAELHTPLIMAPAAIKSFALARLPLAWAATHLLVMARLR